MLIANMKVNATVLSALDYGTGREYIFQVANEGSTRLTKMRAW